MGDVGTVLGPHGDGKSRILCGGFKRRAAAQLHVDVTSDIVTEQVYKAPLVGGFNRGDRVVFVGTRFEDADGVVDVGDVGTVLGPHGDGKSRILCGGFKRRATAQLHVDVTSDIRKCVDDENRTGDGDSGDGAELPPSDSDFVGSTAGLDLGGGGGGGDASAAPVELSFAERVCGSDVDEGLSNLNPIHGLADAPDLSLADACESAKLSAQLKTWDSAIALYAAGKMAKKLAKAGKLEPLSREEAMALHIYTQESRFYKVLNASLRAQDRSEILPFFPYLKLVLRGLRKLPALETTVYRGVKLDLSATYPEDEDCIWRGFTSTTSTIKVMESEMFCGKTGDRTIFAIKTKSAVNITRYSAVANENERLLFPGTPFNVSSVAALGEGLTVIQLEQDLDAPPFISGF